MSGPRTQQLSIYLLKSHVTTPDEAIRDGVEHMEVHLPDDAQPGLSLFVRPTISHPPAW